MTMRVTGSSGSGRRLRRKDGKRMRKTGWQVSATVAEAVREAVEQGAAESQNAFVERALVRELRELRKSKVYEAYAKAARDPAFLADMQAVTNTFDVAVGDGLRIGR